MRRDWLNSTARPTPPTAASRKPWSVVVSVTRSEADSSARSDTSVENTSHGDGSTYGGIPPTRTTSSHSATPSASIAIGRSTRSTRSATGEISSFALPSPIFARSRSRRRLVGPGGRTSQGFRHAPAIAGVIGRSAEAFVARMGRIDRELGEDAARPPRHHHDPLRQVDRLEYRMGHEHDGLAQRFPESQQVVVEAKARDLVE